MSYHRILRYHAIPGPKDLYAESFREYGPAIPSEWVHRTDLEEILQSTWDNWERSGNDTAITATSTTYFATEPIDPAYVPKMWPVTSLDEARAWARFAFGSHGHAVVHQWPFAFAVENNLPTRATYSFGLLLLPEPDNTLCRYLCFGEAETWPEAWTVAVSMGHKVIPGLYLEELRQVAERWVRSAQQECAEHRKQAG
jgi:hypothetical protein